MTDNETLMAVSNSGVSIASEKVALSLAKKKISPSMITGLQGCPASWAANSFVLRDLIKDEPDNAANRGKLFHRVMEIAFDEDSDVRTRDRIREIQTEVLEEDEYSFFKEVPDAQVWLDDAVNGYYEMGGRPRKVKVAELPLGKNGAMTKGLEVFVSSNLAGASRDTLGFIDRLTVDQRPEVEDGVIIEDWKTGAKAKKWNPKTKSDDGRAEARQQVAYSLMLKDKNVNITGARLIYPVAKQVVEVDLTDKKFEEQVLQDIKDTDEALDNYIETNNFEYKPSFLCSWCPLAKICPKAQVEKFPKARAAYATQPPIEVLAQGFEFI